MRLLWQCFVAAIVVGTLAVMVGSIVSPATGDLGLVAQPRGPGVYIVVSVKPGLSADLAGIRAGDVIHVATTFETATRWAARRVGDRVPVVRADGTVVTLVAKPASMPLGLLIVIFTARISFLLIAAFVAWRLPGDPAARALATFLACYGAGMTVDPAFWAPPVLRFVAFLLNEPLFLVGTGALVLFTCRFPTNATTGLRLALRRAVVPATILSIVLTTARISTTFFFGQTWIFRPLQIAYIVIMAGMLAGVIASLVISYRESSSEDRVRVIWVIRTFAVGFSGIVPMLVVVAAGDNEYWVRYLALTIVFIPIGLAYVILRHRVLDIGFVINRALVYTIVSLIVVGTFLAFDWVVGFFVQGRAGTSTLLQLAAVVLGMSTRAIHTKVDAFVDDLFFRDRHAAEASIRRFAQEALMVTDADELIAKTVDVAQRNAHLSAAAYYVRKDGAFVPVRATFDQAPDISENDYAVLALRTWCQRVDLHDYQTLIPGEIVFPMMVRGQLAGFLACGDKSSHEAFTPDERDALEQLARDSGIALDSLQIQALLQAVGAR